jgi:hypothetical protein
MTVALYLESVLILSMRMGPRLLAAVGVVTVGISEKKVAGVLFQFVSTDQGEPLKGVLVDSFGARVPLTSDISSYTTEWFKFEKTNFTIASVSYTGVANQGYLCDAIALTLKSSTGGGGEMTALGGTKFSATGGRDDCIRWH